MTRMRARKTLRGFLEVLQAEAAEKGVPADIAEYAARATGAALIQEDSDRFEFRAKAYFFAVVRRKLARSRGCNTASARLVADSVVTDLLAEGRQAAEVLEELERGWSGTIPETVIEEYRVRLCA